MIHTEQNFSKAIEARRSTYGISKESTISDERIEEIVAFAIKHTPSAFNSQSGRAVVLLGENHDKLWNLTEAALKEIVPAEKFQPTADKMASFRNGYGTVLFFEDQAVVRDLQERFPLYQEKMPDYSLQSSGMLQYIVWTTLHAEGLGASLQHYNPIIDDAVQKVWDIPSDWQLVSQMPFGKPTAAPNEKQFNSVAERMKVFK
ncbi:nitroreductase family protein [Lederbergia sp. NSJ-179]|uniref:nitroreductase family protein n=1 Tax=Lederbergia sp. NSJ-179 TaxID=2931402 RepID=UPI001FD0E503|nr:nitroreductase family protein [Lederbergia sp. NSJ-179]MCJ7841509.1 nitroreductase family protein [Lederbergia sp. NSJ-179]